MTDTIDDINELESTEIGKCWLVTVNDSKQQLYYVGCFEGEDQSLFFTNDISRAAMFTSQPDLADFDYLKVAIDPLDLVWCSLKAHHATLYCATIVEFD